MMHLMDAGRVVIFMAFLAATVKFFILAWNTRKRHPDDEVVQQHFMEHAIAALLGFIGSLVGFIYSLAHLFSIEQEGLSEFPFTVAMFFMLCSGIAFMSHMIKEQTPGHPFYVRENCRKAKHTIYSMNCRRRKGDLA